MWDLEERYEVYERNDDGVIVGMEEAFRHLFQVVARTAKSWGIHWVEEEAWTSSTAIDWVFERAARAARRNIDGIGADEASTSATRPDPISPSIGDAPSPVPPASTDVAPCTSETPPPLSNIQPNTQKPPPQTNKASGSGMALRATGIRKKKKKAVKTSLKARSPIQNRRLRTEANYRGRLSDGFQQLLDVVAEAETEVGLAVEGPQPAQLSKVGVLRRACNLIYSLEDDVAKVRREVRAMMMEEELRTVKAG
ncbi:hypothetical protein MFIFM68171_02336 [Madurella fahalii]|uniref:BHLH domain-containing protein n=1 Tax=Madurella fahalii TaxID=1157608 RepID=A0ABQ0G2Y5_9PEZI